MKWIIALGFIGGMGIMTATSAAATLSAYGMEELEHPEGISLRQDSTRRNSSFFLFYASRRGHYGGGLSGGK